jgi:hypothetical protein
MQLELSAQLHAVLAHTLQVAEYLGLHRVPLPQVEHEGAAANAIVELGAALADAQFADDRAYHGLIVIEHGGFPTDRVAEWDQVALAHILNGFAAFTLGQDTLRAQVRERRCQLLRSCRDQPRERR